jgi:signal transduction histidine kinase
MLNSPIKILVIEDDEEDISLIEIFLTRAKNFSCNLESVMSVKAALERLQQGGIDIILCDLSLPDEQGIETFCQIYAQFSEIPIIIFTGLNDEDVATTALSLGAQDYLIKGEFNSSMLVRAIRYALERQHLSQTLKHQAELLKKQVKQLEVAKRDAEAASQAKTQFLANMTHELRTPLNAILGFTQLLSRAQNLKANQQEHLQIINRSGQHLLGLINDVLEMSKIEAGVTKFYARVFQLQALINSLQEMLALKARDKGLQLISYLAPDLPQYIKTDESKLRQVLLNLLTNAIKFTSEGYVILRVKVLEIPESSENNDKSSKPKNYRLGFEVEDTGCGIAPEDLDTLFDAFSQGKTDVKFIEGAGLGLAISRHFVQLMKGDISIQSQLGKGTVVTFDILVTPGISEGVPQPVLQQRVVGLAPNQPQYRILVVEDRWENRQLLVTMLSRLGFEVLEATNGQEGVQMWETEEPNLIFMDMRMPVMDGYEATKRIRTSLKGQAAVIIALTAYAFEENKAAIIEAGCDDFISKPFQEEVLLEKIAHHLGVQYVYEACEIPADDSVADSSALTIQNLRENLRIMPSQWLSKLHLAASSLDEKQVFSLIGEIPAENSQIKTALENLVFQMRFDAIADLTTNS